MAEGVLGLCHADRKAAVAEVLVLLERLPSRGQELHPVPAVHARDDGLDLAGERHLVRIQEAEVCGAVVGGRPDGLREGLRAPATVDEMRGDHGVPCTGRK